MSLVGAFGAAWGVGGVGLLLGGAVYRLAPMAVVALSDPLGALQWAFLVVWVVFMAVTEGYFGFQRSFSPRVAARARYLAEHPDVLRSFLAPLFCMGYFHATRRLQVKSVLLTVGIVVLVLTVRLVPQPWRGIVDLGVVLGLAWGLVAIGVFTVRAFATDGFDHPPETPPDSRSLSQ